MEEGAYYWWIGIDVSDTEVLFPKTAKRSQKPRPVQFFGEAIHCVETARYLRAILDTRLTWTAQVNKAGRRAAQRLGMLGSLLNRRSGLSIRNGVLLYEQLIRHMMEYSCSI
jgi:hypothetical protein